MHCFSGWFCGTGAVVRPRISCQDCPLSRPLFFPSFPPPSWQSERCGACARSPAHSAATCAPSRSATRPTCSGTRCCTPQCGTSTSATSAPGRSHGKAAWSATRGTCTPCCLRWGPPEALASSQTAESDRTATVVPRNLQGALPLPARPTAKWLMAAAVLGGQARTFPTCRHPQSGQLLLAHLLFSHLKELQGQFSWIFFYLDSREMNKKWPSSSSHDREFKRHRVLISFVPSSCAGASVQIYVKRKKKNMVSQYAHHCPFNGVLSRGASFGENSVGTLVQKLCPPVYS